MIRINLIKCCRTGAVAKVTSCQVNEYDDGDDAVAWILLIPTTLELMNQFLEKKISKKDMYNLTILNVKYEVLYLSSALVLEEFRRKGIAKWLTIEAIEKIQKDYPLKALFV